MRRLVHDPDGWAPNMGWLVVDDSGTELYRGPEWAARLRVGHPEVDLSTGLVPTIQRIGRGMA